MAFKVVLVHLDNSKSTPARLNAVVKPTHAWGASRTGANLAGLDSEIQEKPDAGRALVGELPPQGPGYDVVDGNLAVFDEAALSRPLAHFGDQGQGKG